MPVRRVLFLVIIAVLSSEAAYSQEESKKISRGIWTLTWWDKISQIAERSNASYYEICYNQNRVNNYKKEFHVNLLVDGRDISQPKSPITLNAGSCTTVFGKQIGLELNEALLNEPEYGDVSGTYRLLYSPYQTQESLHAFTWTGKWFSQGGILPKLDPNGEPIADTAAPLPESPPSVNHNLVPLTHIPTSEALFVRFCYTSALISSRPYPLTGVPPGHQILTTKPSTIRLGLYTLSTNGLAAVIGDPRKNDAALFSPGNCTDLDVTSLYAARVSAPATLPGIEHPLWQARGTIRIPKPEIN